jgi:hypothetical protein
MIVNFLRYNRFMSCILFVFTSLLGGASALSAELIGEPQNSLQELEILMAKLKMTYTQATMRLPERVLTRFWLNILMMTRSGKHCSIGNWRITTRKIRWEPLQVIAS